MNRYLPLLIFSVMVTGGCRKQPLLKCAVFRFSGGSRSPRYVLPLDDDARKDLLERLSFGLNEREPQRGCGTQMLDAKASYEKHCRC